MIDACLTNSIHSLENKALPIGDGGLDFQEEAIHSHNDAMKLIKSLSQYVIHFCLFCTTQVCVLTLHHTILTFNDPERVVLENIVGKGENAGKQHFLLFPTMFSTLSNTEVLILPVFHLSSANAFSLSVRRKLSCGNGLMVTDEEI